MQSNERYEQLLNEKNQLIESVQQIEQSLQENKELKEKISQVRLVHWFKISSLTCLSSSSSWKSLLNNSRSLLMNCRSVTMNWLMKYAMRIPWTRARTSLFQMVLLQSEHERLIGEIQQCQTAIAQKDEVLRVQQEVTQQLEERYAQLEEKHKEQHATMIKVTTRSILFSFPDDEEDYFFLLCSRFWPIFSYQHIWLPERVNWSPRPWRMTRRWMNLGMPSWRWISTRHLREDHSLEFDSFLQLSSSRECSFDRRRGTYSIGQCAYQRTESNLGTELSHRSGDHRRFQIEESIVASCARAFRYRSTEDSAIAGAMPIDRTSERHSATGKSTSSKPSRGIESTETDVE